MIRTAIVVTALTLPVAGQTLLDRLDGASVGVIGSVYAPPILVDLDGDGALDLVLACGTCGFQAWFGDGEGGFGPATLIDPTAISFPFVQVSGVAVGDIDGDGDNDVITCRAGGPSFLFVNRGNRQFARDQSGRLPTLDKAWLAAFLDVDADGDLDLFVGNRNSQHELVINDGSGTFSLGVGRLAGGGEWPVYVQAVDLNGDGFGDLVCGAGLQAAARNTVYLNDGAGSLSQRVEVGVSDTTSGLATGDVDGDGDRDLAFANGYGVELLLNDGVGGFSDGVHLLPAAFRGVWSRGVSIADFDLDGNSDLLLGLATPLRFVLLLGDGRGGFVDASSLVRHVSPDSDTLLVGDLDQDGDQDIIVEMYPLLTSAILTNLSRQIHASSAPVRNSPFRVDLYSRTGRRMFLGLSGRSTRVVIPTLGVVVLDPATAVFAAPVYFGTTGVQSMSIPVPANSALLGKTIFAQGFDLDISGITKSHVTNWFDTKIQ